MFRRSGLIKYPRALCEKTLIFFLIILRSGRRYFKIKRVKQKKEKSFTIKFNIKYDKLNQCNSSTGGLKNIKLQKAAFYGPVIIAAGVHVPLTLPPPSLLLTWLWLGTNANEIKIIMKKNRLLTTFHSICMTSSPVFGTVIVVVVHNRVRTSNKTQIWYLGHVTRGFTSETQCTRSRGDSVFTVWVYDVGRFRGRLHVPRGQTAVVVAARELLALEMPIDGFERVAPLPAALGFLRFEVP